MVFIIFSKILQNPAENRPHKDEDEKRKTGGAKMTKKRYFTTAEFAIF
jgi:hypothetical protein